MPKGRLIRQDELTQETLKAKASKKVDDAMLEALTGENGPLPAGLLPSIKTATEAGAKKLLTALDDEGKQVAKVARGARTKDTPSEEVKPKTPLESGTPVSFKPKRPHATTFESILASNIQGLIVSYCSVL